jgi:preprotein translocase subunit SecE
MLPNVVRSLLRPSVILRKDVMKKVIQFFKESYAELKKVVWPGKDDVISSVKVVVISTIIVAAILGLIDMLLLMGIRVLF